MQIANTVIIPADDYLRLLWAEARLAEAERLLRVTVDWFYRRVDEDADEVFLHIDKFLRSADSASDGFVACHDCRDPEGCRTDVCAKADMQDDTNRPGAP